MTLARLYRAGELTGIYVPEPQDGIEHSRKVFKGLVCAFMNLPTPYHITN
jgi:hypothetical protein